MSEFFKQHAGLGCILLAIIFLLSGWFDYDRGSKVLASCTWFLGVVSVSLGIGGSCLFLGVLRWPIAAICFGLGSFAIFRFARKPT